MSLDKGGAGASSSPHEGGDGSMAHNGAADTGAGAGAGSGAGAGTSSRTGHRRARAGSYSNALHASLTPTSRWQASQRVVGLHSKRFVKLFNMPALVADANVLAKRLHAEASRAEPQVTMLLQYLARANQGQLFGLKFRLKTVGSLRRKLVSNFERLCEKTDAAGGDVSALTVADVLKDPEADMNDILRYTMLLPVESYTHGVEAVRRGLVDAGYKPLEMNNFWPLTGSDSREMVSYLGINGFAATPGGYVFELQFHTPESADVKQGASHMLYESFRISADEAERRKLFAQMLQAWRSVQIPDGVQRLGRLRKFPPPAGIRTMDKPAEAAWGKVVAGTSAALERLRGQAAAVEPLVTCLFRYLCVRRRSTLQDEDTVLTSMLNLQRKADMMYRQRAAAGCPVSYEQAATMLPCALDYTVVLNQDTYTDDVHFWLQSMVQQGFRIDAVLNYWLDSDKRRGVQVWFWDPSMSLRCQVRFNTAASYDARLFRRMLIESRVDEQPVVFDGALQAYHGSEELRRLWSSVSVPVGVESIGVVRLDADVFDYPAAEELLKGSRDSTAFVVPTQPRAWMPEASTKAPTGVITRLSSCRSFIGDTDGDSDLAFDDSETALLPGAAGHGASPRRDGALSATAPPATVRRVSAGPGDADVASPGAVTTARSGSAHSGAWDRVQSPAAACVRTETEAIAAGRQPHGAQQTPAAAHTPLVRFVVVAAASAAVAWAFARHAR